MKLSTEQFDISEKMRKTRDSVKQEILREAEQKFFDHSRLDYDKTVEVIDEYCRKFLNYRNSVPVIIVDNPLEAFVGCCYLQAGYHVNQIPSLIKEGIYENGKIKPIYMADNSSKIFEMRKYFHPRERGLFDAYSTTGFEYMMRIWNITIPSDLMELLQLRKEMLALGMIYPMGNAVIVSQKPTHWSYNEADQLHNSSGPSFAYAGNYPANAYHLNGVAVPEWLACTNEGEIDIKMYKEIQNADVKAEFIKKVGIERMLQYGTMIDTYKNYDNEIWNKSEYEIWDMKDIFPNVEFAPHLKMVNQTTGIWHVEALDPSCRKIPEAMKFRLEGDYEIISIA